MEKHFVLYYSPGTFVAEQTLKPIDCWDVETAKEMAQDITERYGATPYGFCFVTKARSDEELDSKETARSNMYYLGGEIQTLEQIERRNNPDDRVLIQNMRCNGFNRVVVNNNSYKCTQPLYEKDVVLEFEALK